MKTITLIPLTTGTGVAHFISSFAMIEKNKMAIIDFDRHSIVKDILLREVSTHISIENRHTLDFASTRFNNSLISIPREKINKRSFEEEFSDDLKNSPFIKNKEFLIINYPYLFEDDILFSLIEYSDYVVFLGDNSLESKLALKEILNTCSDSLFGMILSKPENPAISVEIALNDIVNNKVELIADIPYSLKFQIATIQKKVILELDDKGLFKTISDSWKKIKAAVYSLSVTSN